MLPLPDAFLSLDEADLQRLLGAWLPPHEAVRVRVAIRRAGLQVIPFDRWPVGLRRVRPPARALFVRGDPELLWRPAVAIVGARRAHGSAEHWARELAAYEARAGHVVVSGGARGIDSAAHLGALDAGGKTVAYLGVAADQVYPRHNVRLFTRILEQGGALVSEHLPLTRTFKGTHALRNRFIAAQAQRLYVAEADLSSGSLGTAAYASRMGVPVLVSPAGIGVRRAGLDALLASGAGVAT